MSAVLSLSTEREPDPRQYLPHPARPHPRRRGQSPSIDARNMIRQTAHLQNLRNKGASPALTMPRFTDRSHPISAIGAPTYRQHALSPTPTRAPDDPQPRSARRLHQVARVDLPDNAPFAPQRGDQMPRDPTPSSAPTPPGMPTPRSRAGMCPPRFDQPLPAANVYPPARRINHSARSRGCSGRHHTMMPLQTKRAKQTRRTNPQLRQSTTLQREQPGATLCIGSGRGHCQKEAVRYDT